MARIDFRRSLLRQDFNNCLTFIDKKAREIEIALLNRQDGTISDSRLNVTVQKAKIDSKYLQRTLPGNTLRVDEPWAIVDVDKVSLFAHYYRSSSKSALDKLFGYTSDSSFGVDQFSAHGQQKYEMFVNFFNLCDWTRHTAILTEDKMGLKPIESTGTCLDGHTVVPRGITLGADPVFMKVIGFRQAHLFDTGGEFEQLTQTDKRAAFASFWVSVANVIGSLQDSHRRAQDHNLSSPYMSLDDATVWLKSLSIIAQQLHSAMEHWSQEDKTHLSEVTQKLVEKQTVSIHALKDVEEMMVQWHSFKSWNVLEPDWKPPSQFPDQWKERFDRNDIASISGLPRGFILESGAAP